MMFLMLEKEKCTIEPEIACFLKIKKEALCRFFSFCSDVRHWNRAGDKLMQVDEAINLLEGIQNGSSIQI